MGEVYGKSNQMSVAIKVILWHGFSVESHIGELKRDPVSGKASGRDRMTPDDAQGIAEVSQVVDIKCHQMPDTVKLKWCITNICFETVDADLLCLRETGISSFSKFDFIDIRSG